MKKSMIRKGIISIVIVLFLILGSSPSIGELNKEYKKMSVNKSESWWDYDWEFRKQLDIEDATDDYQMIIQVWKENGHDDVNNGIIDCEDHCNNDFSDIRFIDNDHITILPYWIEEFGTDQSDHFANIWVKTTDSDTIFMYYGATGVSSLSNGYDTWDWYEEWTTDKTNEYTTVQRFNDPNWYADYGHYNRMETSINVPFRQLTKWKINIWVNSISPACAGHGVSADEDDYLPTDGIYVLFNADTSHGSSSTNIACYLKSIKSGNTTYSGYSAWSFSPGTYYITDLFIESTSYASANIYSLNRDTIHQTLYVTENISSTFNTNYFLEYVATIPTWGSHYWNYNDAYDSIEYGGNHFADPTSRCEMWTPWTCVGKYSETEPYWSEFGSEEIVNHGPEIPEINGPTSGEIGTNYDFTFVTEDPDDEDVYYQIDWGDGDIDDWFGPYESNEIVIKSHTWDEQGTFTIKARAKDIGEEISDWGILEVEMPVNQLVKYPLFNWYFIQSLERFHF